MSALVFVRHAQASFFEKDYDRLSTLGETQARCLGEFWTRHGVRFDEVCAGPRIRHRRTAELVGACYRSAGLAWPETSVLDALDEHTVDRLLKDSLPELSRRHPELEARANAFAEASAPAEVHRTFQLLFEAVVHLWSEGSATMTGVEPWPAYRDHVRESIKQIVRAGPSGRRIAVFTSVGPISVALGQALRCPDRVAFELGWRLRNASLTEFVFSRDRQTLDSFNTLPHLDDPALWTFR